MRATIKIKSELRVILMFSVVFSNLRCECEHGVPDDVELGGSQHSYPPVGASCQPQPRVTT